MIQPLLSIIIPTRNRYSTLIPVVEAIADIINNISVELVIQDNSDANTEILNHLVKYPNSKIQYFYTASKISMVDNAELAIRNSSGKFLIFIGDDDIINPYIFQIVEYMDINNINSLIYPIANYFYCDVSFKNKYGFNKPGALSFIKDFNDKLYQLKTKEELRRVAHCGAVYILDLPRLYHGIIRRELAVEIKNFYGKYIPGPCPDMTLSCALAQILNEHYKINIPLSIAGNSSISEGGKGPTNKHIVKLEDKEWLNQNDILDWDMNIPRIFSRETIWAQSFYHVNAIQGLNNINYIELYNSMIFSCPYSTLKYINPLYLRLNISFYHKIGAFVIAYIKRYTRKFLFSLPPFLLELTLKLRGDYNLYVLKDNIKSIRDCMNMIETITRETLTQKTNN